MKAKIDYSNSTKMIILGAASFSQLALTCNELDQLQIFAIAKHSLLSLNSAASFKALALHPFSYN